MKKAILISFICLSMLNACAFLDKTPKGTITERSAQIDPKVLQACPKLPIPTATTIESILIGEDLAIIEMYGLCAKKQDDSIKVIKELANIKDK